MLELKNVCYKLASRQIFNQIDCSFEPGVTALLGGNGEGKTILLDCIAGFRKLNRGEIILNGKFNLPQAPRLVTYMVQNPYFPLRLVCEDVVKLAFAQNRMSIPPNIPGLSPEERDRWDRIKRTPYGAISNGEAKWLCLWIFTHFDSPVYLLDEPTSGVDPAFRTLISNHMERLERKNAVVIFTTHIESDVLERYHKVHLHRGSLSRA